MVSRIEPSTSSVTREWISDSSVSISSSYVPSSVTTILERNVQLLREALIDLSIAEPINKYAVEERLDMCVETIVNYGIFHQVLKVIAEDNMMLYLQIGSMSVVTDHHSYWHPFFSSKALRINQELVWIAESCLRAGACLQAAEVLDYLPNSYIKKLSLSDSILQWFHSHEEMIGDDAWKELAKHTFDLYTSIEKFKKDGKLSIDFQNPFLGLVNNLEKQTKLYLVKDYLEPMLLCFCRDDGLMYELMQDGHMIYVRDEGNEVWLAILIPKYLKVDIISNQRIVDYSHLIQGALAFYQ